MKDPCVIVTADQPNANFWRACFERAGFHPTIEEKPWVWAKGTHVEQQGIHYQVLLPVAEKVAARDFKRGVQVALKTKRSEMLAKGMLMGISVLDHTEVELMRLAALAKIVVQSPARKELDGMATAPPAESTAARPQAPEIAALAIDPESRVWKGTNYAKLWTYAIKVERERDYWKGRACPAGNRPAQHALRWRRM